METPCQYTKELGGDSQVKKVVLYLALFLVFALPASLLVGCFIWHGKVSSAEVKLALGKRRVFIATPPFALTGGTPAGGRYEGAGVIGGTFSPESAGVGVHEIIYTVADASATDRIEVFGPRSRKANSNCNTCLGTGLIDCVSRVPCKNCDVGYVKAGKCETCEGRGRFRTAWKLWLDTKECPDCRGSGMRCRLCEQCKGFGDVKCPRCKGTGKAECHCKK